MLIPEEHKKFLIFLGDATTLLQAKTATGVLEWLPSSVIGCLPSPNITLDVPSMTFATAKSSGATTLLIGCAPRDGLIPPSWYELLKLAMGLGFNIASGLHEKLTSIPELVECASITETVLYDFRHRETSFPKGTGLNRTGRRLLTVGLDCSSGKKYTALSLHKRCVGQGLDVSFRSTGQTGYLISASGINNDTVIADFLSGAAEYLTPDAHKTHWDIIEGQGAVSHPAYGAGSLSLLHGSQPDLIVMCLDPVRKFHNNTNFPLADLGEEIQLCLTLARRTNPSVQLGAISINTSVLPKAEASLTLEEIMRKHYPNYALRDDVLLVTPNKPETLDPLIDKMRLISEV